MAIKHVTSRDPRKPQIVAALRKLSGARRITQVAHDTSTNTFRGNCLYATSSDPRVGALGGLTVVTAAECGLPELPAQAARVAVDPGTGAVETSFKPFKAPAGWNHTED